LYDSSGKKEKKINENQVIIVLMSTLVSKVDICDISHYRNEKNSDENGEARKTL